MQLDEVKAGWRHSTDVVSCVLSLHPRSEIYLGQFGSVSSSYRTDSMRKIVMLRRKARVREALNAGLSSLPRELSLPASLRPSARAYS